MYSSDDDAESGVFVRNADGNNRRDTELVYFAGQMASLKCQVANEGEKVVWLRDGSYVPVNDKYTTVDEGVFR